MSTPNVIIFIQLNHYCLTSEIIIFPVYGYELFTIPDYFNMYTETLFTAGLAHGVTLGPHQAVEFDKVMANVGNAYVSRDGQFTAPVYG
jgi:hypothetical protein